jgi:hypothetical protein
MSVIPVVYSLQTSFSKILATHMMRAQKPLLVPLPPPQKETLPMKNFKNAA